MDTIPLTEEQQAAPSADKSFVIRSVAGGSSSSSNTSSASLTAAKARAKVQAAHACTVFVQKENELLLEQAWMDAALAMLKLNKGIAATVAEAEALKSTVAELERGFRASNIGSLPPQSPQERTSKYVECHSKAASEPTLTKRAHHQPQQCNATTSNSAAADLSNGGLSGTRPHMSTSQPAKPDPDADTQSFYPTGSHHFSTFSSTLHKQAPHTLPADRTGFGDIARFLARQELRPHQI